MYTMLASRQNNAIVDQQIPSCPFCIAPRYSEYDGHSALQHSQQKSESLQLNRCLLSVMGGHVASRSVLGEYLQVRTGFYCPTVKNQVQLSAESRVASTTRRPTRLPPMPSMCSLADWQFGSSEHTVHCIIASSCHQSV